MTLLQEPAVGLEAWERWTPDEVAAWQTRVHALAAERNAVILAHNYQAPIIQDVAHHVGDSLALSRIAATSDAETIVFAGVHFMAETAKLLSPAKRVLIPDQAAGCSLADTINADQLRAWKAEHPGAVVEEPQDHHVGHPEGVVDHRAGQPGRHARVRNPRRTAHPAAQPLWRGQPRLAVGRRLCRAQRGRAAPGGRAHPAVARFCSPKRP